MQLSLHADYALRVLIYVGAHPDEPVSTEQISTAYGISRHHLVRVVHTLGECGYLRVTPGRSGGVRLAMDPSQIRLGEVVRHAEPNLHLVECFDKETNTCPIISVCGLKTYLQEALRVFLDELDRHTLADLLAGSGRKNLRQVLYQLGPIGAGRGG
ncbi:MAG: Rrf2 family transcriptional regulator [Acidobacteriia bacterium]|nr:Rrf2 family transcriptional regulator [Terriglobia bacterium]